MRAVSKTDSWQVGSDVEVLGLRNYVVEIGERTRLDRPC
jgi:hypothetical protein